ncbi:hypothetical protein CC78DRAFT_185710 [Lojkania enalia]|uniref:Uncharacterized protein n=1 Tax=Lojkania enalia TaxID=147567 RepID=A0A9P4KA70_9PLEO|nr:hypothetical protein CC78DRAFT_185710 [Didymosphaeria enalia]
MYMDIVLGGRCFKKIEEMHREYDPIVASTAQEVYISDPTFYNEIHPGPLRRRERTPKMREQLLHHSHFVTIDHG